MLSDFACIAFGSSSVIISLTYDLNAVRNEINAIPLVRIISVANKTDLAIVVEIQK